MTTKTTSKTRARTTKHASAAAAPQASMSAAAPPEVEAAEASVMPQPHVLTDAELQLFMTSDTTESSVGADASASAPAPTMTPPGIRADDDTAGAPSSAGVAISGQKVTALWAEQSHRNAWAHLQTAGWKKLSPMTDSGSTTMTLLAAHARATGTAPYLDEAPAGTLGTMYVW